jgi:NitT/TauT family transport system substrate-binding protein
VRPDNQEHSTNLLRRFANYLATLAPRREKPLRTQASGHPHRRLWYAAAAGVVAVAAAGCASGSSGNGSSGASSGSNSSSSAKTTSITIALPVAEPVQAPVYLAAQLGYFSKEGINAHVVVLAGDTAADAALVAGSVQYTSVNAEALISAAQKGVPLQDICTEYNGPSWALAVSSSVLSSTHVTASTPLKQLLTALRGIKVAIVGTAVSAPGLILTGLLKEQGLPANWLSLVGVSASSDLTSAYSHGEVGAVFDTQPTPDEAVQNFGGKVVFDTTQLSALAQIPWEGLVGDKSYISGNAKVDMAVCAAIGEANNYILKNPSAAASDLAGTFPSLSATLLKDSLVEYKWAPDAGMTAAQWAASAKLMTQFGLVSPVSSSTLSGAYTTMYLPAG